MNRLFLSLILLGLCYISALADSFGVFGMIINKSTGEPVDECQITFWRGDSICYNIKADFNGYYIPEVE